MRVVWLAAAAPLLLAACSTVVVDERAVFYPNPYDEDLAEERGERIFGESVFAEPTNNTLTLSDNGQLARFKLTKETFVPTEIVHDRIDDGAGGIAITTFTREGEGRPYIVRCGGNASTRQNSATLYALPTLPFGDVLTFDYPGSGETPGEATAESFEAMGDHLAAYIVEAAGPDRPVVLWGHSLGGFVCADLAGRLPRVDGVVFEASARNAEDTAKTWIPWYAKPFVRVEIAPTLAAYDNVDALSEIDAPALVLGGRRDKTLRVPLSRALAAALEADGRSVAYVEFRKGGHSNLGTQPGFHEAAADFFARIDAET